MYQQPSPSTGASTVPEATSSAVPATSSPAPAPSASSAQLLPPQINVAASAASLPSASTCAPAPVAPAPGPSPNGMTTSYGMVVWPSLPGLQQAAVGVAPPQPSPQAMVGGHSGGVMGRGILGPMTSGRGGIPMRVGVGGLVMSGAASAAGSPGLDVGREDESETEKAQQRKQLASRKESSRSQQVCVYVCIVCLFACLACLPVSLMRPIFCCSKIFLLLPARLSYTYSISRYTRDGLISFPSFLRLSRLDSRIAHANWPS